MKEEIKQNGETILSSQDDISIKMIFNNLIGKNFIGKQYEEYIKYIAIRDNSFMHGIIERVEDGEVKEKGLITKKSLFLNTQKNILNGKRLDKYSISYCINSVDPHNCYGRCSDQIKREEYRQEFIKIFGIDIK